MPETTPASGGLRMGYERSGRLQYAVIAVLTLALLFIGGWHRYETQRLSRLMEQEKRQFASALFEAETVADTIRLRHQETEKDNIQLRRENQRLHDRVFRAEFDRKYALQLETQVDYYEGKYGKDECILPGGKP